jgi:hypothetical protein
MSTMPESRINVKAETQVADAATIALFKAVWSPEGSPEAQEAALALHDALAAQDGRQGPSAASSDDSPPDAESRDWWAEETREDGGSWLSGDMTETERLTIPATRTGRASTEPTGKSTMPRGTAWWTAWPWSGAGR